MILHVIKNFPAIIALFLSPCGQSWWLEERLSVPPLSGREDRYRWILPTTNAQEIAPFVQRPACLHITLESSLLCNFIAQPNTYIGIGLLQHHLGFLPLFFMVSIHWDGWNIFFGCMPIWQGRWGTVECQPGIMAPSASWYGCRQSWTLGAHDRTCRDADYAE